MAFWIMVIILLICALLGGIANYLLPANTGEDGKSKIRDIWSCIFLGLAATILVPFFLELAQSKLLDGIRFSVAWESPVGQELSRTKTSAVDSLSSQNREADSSKILGDTTTKKESVPASKNKTPETEDSEKDPVRKDLGKNYFLWASYCLVAAAAGFRFIDMLINNVIKQGEIKNLKAKNDELVQQSEREATQNKLNAQVAEQKAIQELAITNAANMAKTGVSGTNTILPIIGPITNPNDPQKGRFGGQAIRNDRQLKASVTKSYVPGFFKVMIWVESTDPINHPLIDNVIFYIHDSFRPNVYTITPVNGRAEDDDILSYGAFTVGAVADNGATLLELDLADDPSFPKKFREN